MRNNGNTLASIVCPILCAILVVTPALAHQVHIADGSALEQALRERLNEDDADRQAIFELFQRPEVRKIATRAQVDLQRAEAAVATLSGAELREIATNARGLNEVLSGGNSITISTTTIIIALLVLILIIVAV